MLKKRMSRNIAMFKMRFHDIFVTIGIKFSNKIRS